MRCTVTGEPYTVFGYGGKQVRDNIHSADVVARVRRVPRERRARPRSTTSAAGASRNCSMLEAIALCERDRRARARLDALATRRASATTAGGSPTSSAFERDYPDWAADATTSRTSCARSTTRTSSAGRRRRDEALGRHPRPQRGGLDRADAARRSSTRSSARAIDYEIVVVDDALDATAPRDVVARLAERRPARALHPLALPQRLRLRRARRARRLRRATPWRS